VWSPQPSTRVLPCFVCMLSYQIVNNHFDNPCKVGYENPNSTLQPDPNNPIPGPTPQPGPNPGPGTGTGVGYKL
jgi:hypothetical protein